MHAYNGVLTICVDRLRGFRSGCGRILPFSIDLAGRH